MKTKEIKVKIEAQLYDRAMEYNIDLEQFLSNELLTRVNEISNEIIRENARKERREYDNEQKIIKIIKRMSKTSKFDYASQDGIIAEAELEWINKEEVIKILEKLEERKEVYKPIKSNYRVVKGKPKY